MRNEDGCCRVRRVHAQQLSKRAARFLAASSLLAILVSGIVIQSAPAEETSSPSAHPTASNDDVVQLRQDLKKALEGIRDLQERLDSEHSAGASDNSNLQEQLDEQRARVDSIEQRLDSMTSSYSFRTVSATTADEPSAPPRKLDAGYDNGFFIRSENRNFAVSVNGLLQFRYTGFKPNSENAAFVPGTGWVNNFDVFLGRLALSGNLFDPSVNYFFQYQGITATNSNAVGMLDWWASKTFSKGLTLKAGRTWTLYTYEYNDSPATYLFPDLSTAEYAFALPRAIGVEASGQAGKLSYGAMIANSIPALDVGSQDNFNSKLAYIGHFGVDILAPFGGVETDPNRTSSDKTALSLWASAAYNPVTAPSGFENLAAGDTTINGTATLGLRVALFTLQTTGYWRRTRPLGSLPSDDSWGYGVQGGYYLVPKKFEVAARVTGVNWGALHFEPAGPSNTWFAGPTFPYKTVQEDSFGMNYYFRGHHAKMQAAYSYLHGDTFSHASYAANRIWLQTQLMF